MHLALIPPVSLLKYTLMTSYQLVLPHMMKESAEYNDHYTKLAKSKQHYIILDNGEAEGYNYFSPAMLYGMAAHLGFQEVVIKDSMKDMEGTKTMTKEFFNELTPDRLNEPKVRFGAVVQGTSMHECIEITKWYLDNYIDYVSTLYIPRHLINTLGDIHARIKVTQELDRIFRLQREGITVHLLGAHHDAPVEPVVATNSIPWVRGMDTSMPFNYAWAGALVGEGHHARPEEYFSLLFDREQMRLADVNVAQFIKWVYRNGNPRTQFLGFGLTNTGSYID